MQKALYLHGFASAYKEDSEKIQTLKKHFEVVPFSYPTGNDYKSNLELICSFVKENQIEFIMGCSMGGFFTFQVCAKLGIRGVALNPAIELRQTLHKYMGENRNFVTGESFTMTSTVIESYPKTCSRTGDCLVYLMLGDELLDSEKTYNELINDFTCYLLDGGEHRFADIEGIIPEILSFARS